MATYRRTMMTVVKEGYGLLYKKSNKLLGFYTSSNSDGEDCCEEQFILDDDYAGRVWIVDNELTAGYVRMFSTEWYNAGYDTPTNPYKPEELKVVKITISAEPITVDIPTYREFIEQRYNNPGFKYYDPDHAKYVLDELERFPDRVGHYSIYDLQILKRDLEKL
jgi:site-specific DNA-adenine methylase